MALGDLSPRMGGTRHLRGRLVGDLGDSASVSWRLVVLVQGIGQCIVHLHIEMEQCSFPFFLAEEVFLGAWASGTFLKAVRASTYKFVETHKCESERWQLLYGLLALVLAAWLDMFEEQIRNKISNKGERSIVSPVTNPVELGACEAGGQGAG
jgi:hypothetical protein